MRADCFGGKFSSSARVLISAVTASGRDSAANQTHFAGNRRLLQLAGFCLAPILVLPVQAVGPNNTLNDTGITQYGNASSNTLATEPADYPGQDARFGRDAKASAGQLTKIGGGSAGFDFTALDANGQPTTPSSGVTPHPCVRDNVTGLIWEVKTADGGLRDGNWTYTWYDTNSATNGGSPGVDSGTANCYTASRCDTEKYVADINAVNLCGIVGWRMPTLKELESLVDYSRLSPSPSIDIAYFPNTPAAHFWSASPIAASSSVAWGIAFGLGGGGDGNNKSGGSRVRLVRGDD